MTEFFFNIFNPIRVGFYRAKMSFKNTNWKALKLFVVGIALGASFMWTAIFLSQDDRLNAIMTAIKYSKAVNSTVFAEEVIKQ